MSSYRPVPTAGASGTATLSDSPASASLTALQLLSNGNYHVMVTNTGALCAIVQTNRCRLTTLRGALEALRDASVDS
jgi:hypothetical protein